MVKRKYKKQILRAVKIALGSSAAIYIASLLHLDYEISAGTIALLTIVTTKMETIRLSLYRIITLLFSICMAWVVFGHFNNEWAAFGLFIFVLVMMCEMLGWGATLSVNAVIGSHFLTRLEFSGQFILNEVLLVLIGITIAIVLNLFNDNESSRKELIIHMRSAEKQLQVILAEMASYLLYENMQRDVWEDIRQLEEQLKQYIIDACEHHDNTFSSHPQYYIDYFEMRMQQCNILDSLHSEITKIRNMPVQAKIIADYILYMKDYVVEISYASIQLEQLYTIFEDMKKEPLPESVEEFESRAILYHVLMDLEEFLIIKKKFVDGLDEKQKEIYWKQEKRNCH